MCVPMWPVMWPWLAAGNRNIRNCTKQLPPCIQCTGVRQTNNGCVQAYFSSPPPPPPLFWRVNLSLGIMFWLTLTLGQFERPNRSHSTPALQWPEIRPNLSGSVFFGSMPAGMLFTKRNENRAWSQVSFAFFSLHQKNPFGKLFSKTVFKSSSEAPFLRKVGKLKISLNSVEGPMEIMQIRAFSKRSYEKTKANLQFIFTGLLHNSQIFFQAIFYLYLSFLFISYTRTKKVMFRALMTPRITSFQKDIASRVYIFNSYKRVLLKELLVLFVILKAFLARQKRAR